MGRSRASAAIGMRHRLHRLARIRPERVWTDLRGDGLPQRGGGGKGFLVGQFRPEGAGAEAPAWGLVKREGTARPITDAARTFRKTIAPHAETIMKCPPPQG